MNQPILATGGAGGIIGSPTIGIIGLGYVGLPLAVEFGRRIPVIGFDIKQARIAELNAGHDRTREVGPEELAQAKHFTCTADPEHLRACNVFIVTVPTPVDSAKRPDLTPLIKASETVGKVMPAGAVVIYESTVYPGATEEVCVPLAGKTFRPHVQSRFLRRLQPRAHQPRRQAAPAAHDQEGDLWLHRRNRRLRRCPLPQHRHRRHAQGEFDQSGRSRQGDSEPHATSTSR